MTRPSAIAAFSAFAALSALPPLVAQQRGSADPFAVARAHARAAVVDSGVPSLAIAVAKNGKIVWEEGFGWADREARIPATEHTTYSLASISKPITATGLMILVERGRVKLDNPANDYLGTGKITGLAGDASQATVRRVANHTAGLPLHYMFYYDGAIDRVPTMDEVIARYAVTVYPPGSSYQYSNLGFGILDHIIARVSGQSYKDFMRAEVFLPLGMTHSSIDIAPGLEPYAAVRYDNQGKRVPWYTFDHNGGSAVWSSAHDLVRFGMFHLKNRLPDQQRILADSTLDAMHKNSTGVPNAGYGIGWGIGDDNGLLRVAHTGGMPGVNTALYLYPEENIAIAVLSNTTSRHPFTVATDIIAGMVPRYADTLKARRGRPAAPTNRSVTAPAQFAGEWKGTLRTWDGTQPFTLTFQPDGDVVAKLGNSPRSLLWETAWQGDSIFTGRFAGTVPTADASLHRHSIFLNLTLRGGKLSGQASAQTLPPDTVYYARTSYVDLGKN
jgi:CubicO group peptidase (beta-lactamase class C family)